MRAKEVKLADKICNLRDIMASPPKDWSYLIHLADQDSFAMSGLWDSSTADDGTITQSFTIITLQPHRSWHKSTTIRNASPRSWLARTVKLVEWDAGASTGRAATISR